MRIVSAVLLAAGLLTTVVASAQEPPLPGVNVNGVGHYCFFNSRVYSLGARICSPNNNVLLVCVSAKEVKTESGSDRARWDVGREGSCPRLPPTKGG